MTVFEVRPASEADGPFSAAWFDDDACLWNDERLSRSAPLAPVWVVPSLGLHPPCRRATDVLFNPNALAVSDAVRNALASFAGLEFLPVRIEGHGVFHILHVIATIELPAGSVARTSPVSGNIVQVGAFPRTFHPEHAFFRILQPTGSAGRRTDATTRTIYASIAGARAIMTSAGGCLTISELSRV